MGDFNLKGWRFMVAAMFFPLRIGPTIQNHLSFREYSPEFQVSPIAST
jgi:hypothetical protein